jgi:hypothetical protein
MNQIILKKIKQLKKEYETQGFIILGVFGSYSRDEQKKESDVDILYEMTNDFYNKYTGWKIFGAIDDIHFKLEKKLGKKVDLANKNALNEIGKKFILPEVFYV